MGRCSLSFLHPCWDILPVFLGTPLILSQSFSTLRAAPILLPLSAPFTRSPSPLPPIPEPAPSPFPGLSLGLGHHQALLSEAAAVLLWDLHSQELGSSPNVDTHWRCDFGEALTSGLHRLRWKGGRQRSSVIRD